MRSIRLARQIDSQKNHAFSTTVKAIGIRDGIELLETVKKCRSDRFRKRWSQQTLLEEDRDENPPGEKRRRE
jgi:hypothetical protein